VKRQEPLDLKAFQIPRKDFKILQVSNLTNAPLHCNWFLRLMFTEDGQANFHRFGLSQGSDAHRVLAFGFEQGFCPSLG
jgi:hypothetical protein